jgi:hypothetical protein
MCATPVDFAPDFSVHLGVITLDSARRRCRTALDLDVLTLRLFRESPA